MIRNIILADEFADELLAHLEAVARGDIPDMETAARLLRQMKLAIAQSRRER